MTSNPTIKWVALALVGLLIAAVVAVLGSSLASRQIGLSSEPLRAGDALAPPTISRPPTEKPAKPKDTGPVPAPKSQPSNPEGPNIPTTPSQPVAPPTEPLTPSEPTEPTGDHHDGEGGDD
jgi:type IV secretory pathway VirB10-like protein